jgi:uncharacterized phage-associated protein
MSYKPKTIAEWFIHRAAQDDKTLTQMKLQKLVYIAHGWSLASRSKPLIDAKVEAWKWGPVIRPLYGAYARYGSDPIAPSDDAPEIDESGVEDLLEAVWEVYGGYTAAELSAMTHRDGTPWSSVYEPDAKNVIPNSLIKAHYKTLSEEDDE